MGRSLKDQEGKAIDLPMAPMVASAGWFSHKRLKYTMTVKATVNE